ncbi:MAG TPA: hypothetical protein VGH73_21440 [Thermoanaerobaculia bacterium]
MSAATCPDWSRLAVLRRGGEEPAGWAAAAAHLDACPRCRREALAADPLLVFRRLPAIEMTAAEESSEAESMRQAVSAMRTARRLESRQRFAGWRRWAAAAVLAAVSLAVGRDRSPLARISPIPEPAARPVAAELAAPRQDAEPVSLEGMNRPDARVYQMSGKDLSAVMIVDKNLDV